MAVGAPCHACVALLVLLGLGALLLMARPGRRRLAAEPLGRRVAGPLG